MSKLYYIETYGCEMNKSDSLDIALSLEERGYRRADTQNDADVIVLNTCAVRENAEDRLAGRLGYYRSLKRGRKGKPLVVVAGCVAQEKGAELIRLHPEIDVVSGTDHFLDIADFVEASPEKPFVAVDGGTYRFSSYGHKRAEGHRAWVSIIKGCSNFCSYCIVPHLRGGEISKKSSRVIAEAEELSGRGVVEVTLLGQNVNAYGRDSRDIGFIELLERVARVPAIRWIRFLTSHPKDFTREGIRKIADIGKVCGHIHLPLQSGSDRILSLMNRGYTVDHFIGLVEEIRSSLPGASITTDLITGFPGETEEDFEETLSVVRRVEFDDAFTYRYSERPFTAARGMGGKVDPLVSGRRLGELIAIQRGISLKKNREEVGKTHEVLVERPSRKDASEYLCKTESAKMVIVRTDVPPGTFIDVEVTGISGNTLRGVQKR